MSRADKAMKILREADDILDKYQQFDLLETFVEDLKEHSEETALEKLQTNIKELEESS